MKLAAAPSSFHPKVDIKDLPARMSRKMAAAVITHYYFPVSARSLEIWPVSWRIVNGRALGETSDLLRVAAEKLASTPSIRG